MKKCASCGREFPDTSTFCPFDGKKLESPYDADRFIGSVLDAKYFIEKRVGQGGMGNVYKAKHLHMDAAVAVKILHPHLVSDQTTVERFRREARAAVAVNHPNAIHVMDFGVTEDKTVYLVMELLEGINLRKILETERPLSPERTVELIKQTCAAVDAAHAKNIIHRDLKPDNIVILKHGTANEQVKVLDFSIAKLRSQTDGPVNLTQQGMVVGTPQYMSPEQAEGQELDARSDIYSLGVILYEMLTGELPFKASTPMALILKHIHALPRPLRELRDTIHPALEAVVLRALAKKREDRPQSAPELAGELAEALRQSKASSAPLPESVSARDVEPVAAAKPSPPKGQPMIKSVQQPKIGSQDHVSSVEDSSGDWSDPSYSGAGKRKAALAAGVGTAPVASVERSAPPSSSPDLRSKAPREAHLGPKPGGSQIVYIIGGLLLAIVVVAMFYICWILWIRH